VHKKLVLKRKRGEDILTFARRVGSEIIEKFLGEGHAVEPVSFVVFERQFDRSPDKPLERLLHIVEFVLYDYTYRTCNEWFGYPAISLGLEYSPTQMKKYVTGKGNADEAEYWRKIERKCATGQLPFGDIDNQHLIEAGIYALMGLDWYHVYYRGDEAWKCHGNREGAKKPKILWNFDVDF